MGKTLAFGLMVIGLLLETLLVSAQNVDSLNGVVLNLRNNQPVKGAEVRLMERAGFSSTSEESGNFKLKFDPPLRVGETVRIRVEKQGFKTLIQSVQARERALILNLIPTEGPNYRKWISLGVSLAAAGAAAAFFQAANDSRESAEAARTESEFEQFDDDFHRNRVFTITFEILSGAAGGYFLYEQFLRKKPPSEVIVEESTAGLQVHPQLAREGVMVVFRKRF